MHKLQAIHLTLSRHTLYLPHSYPSMSHVCSSDEVSLYSDKPSLWTDTHTLLCPSPEWPVIQNTFHSLDSCDSWTIHQSRKDLHDQRVSGPHHPKGPSSVSHSLLILVQSNWVDWTPVLVWSMRHTWKEGSGQYCVHAVQQKMISEQIK